MHSSTFSFVGQTGGSELVWGQVWAFQNYQALSLTAALAVAVAVPVAPAPTHRWISRTPESDSEPCRLLGFCDGSRSLTLALCLSLTPTLTPDPNPNPNPLCSHPRWLHWLVFARLFQHFRVSV